MFLKLYKYKINLIPSQTLKSVITYKPNPIIAEFPQEGDIKKYLLNLLKKIYSSRLLQIQEMPTIIEQFMHNRLRQLCNKTKRNFKSESKRNLDR